MKLKCLIFFGLLSVFLSTYVYAQMQVLSGSYTGDGTDNRAITGLGFQPDVVIIKGNTNRVTVCRTSTMTGDNTKLLASEVSLQPNRIQSLDSDGFTVGTNPTVNSSGISYYWVAFTSASDEMVLGSYTGDGSANRYISGLGFQPGYVIIMAAHNQLAVHRSSVWPSSLSTDKSFTFTAQSGFTTGIRAIESDGFRVGSHNRVNQSGTATYHYIAWKEINGSMDVGVYSGDGTDIRNITGVGFQPEWVIVKSNSSYVGLHHPESLGATNDTTLPFSGAAGISNCIQELQSDGFQIGSNVRVNCIGTSYFWAAFKKQIVTAVTLTSFTAGADESGNVALTWQTATETDNAGFNIYRSKRKNGNYTKLNNALIPSEGNEVEGASYSYEDTPPASGAYYYKLEDVDYNETTTMHGPVKARVRKIEG